jgi:hypothetical protein
MTGRRARSGSQVQDRSVFRQGEGGIEEEQEGGHLAPAGNPRPNLVPLLLHQAFAVDRSSRDQIRREEGLAITIDPRMVGGLEGHSDHHGDGQEKTDGGRVDGRGYYLLGGFLAVFPALLLSVTWRARHVEMGLQGIKVTKGLRHYFVRWEEIVAVFTTMMPKGKDFQEVLAVEFVRGTDGAVLALDPAWGFDIAEAVAALREALGERWEELYLGHKHASEVRGLLGG